jgi:hypothetical protein
MTRFCDILKHKYNLLDWADQQFFPVHLAALSTPQALLAMLPGRLTVQRYPDLKAKHHDLAAFNCGGPPVQVEAKSECYDSDNCFLELAANIPENDLNSQVRTHGTEGWTYLSRRAGEYAASNVRHAGILNADVVNGHCFSYIRANDTATHFLFNTSLLQCAVVAAITDFPLAVSEPRPDRTGKGRCRSIGALVPLDFLKVLPKDILLVTSNVTVLFAAEYETMSKKANELWAERQKQIEEVLK